MLQFLCGAITGTAVAVLSHAAVEAIAPPDDAAGDRFAARRLAGDVWAERQARTRAEQERDVERLKNALLRDMVRRATPPGGFAADPGGGAVVPPGDRIPAPGVPLPLPLPPVSVPPGNR